MQVLFFNIYAGKYKSCVRTLEIDATDANTILNYETIRNKNSYPFGYNKRKKNWKEVNIQQQKEQTSVRRLKMDEK